MAPIFSQARYGSSAKKIIVVLEILRRQIGNHDNGMILQSDIFH